MAVTITGTPAAASNSSSNSLTLSGFTVPSDATLMIVTVGRWGDPASTYTLGDWVTTTEPFTTLSGDDSSPITSAAGDAGLYIYGIINPTAKTADIVLSPGGTNDNWNFIVAQCFKGTVTTSLNDAAIIRDAVSDTSGTGSTTVFTGTFGSSPNSLFAAGSAIGGDMTPATGPTGYTLIEEGGTGLDSGNTDGSWYTAYGDAPDTDATITWAINDESAGFLVELVAASTTTTIEIPTGPVR